MEPNIGQRTSVTSSLSDVSSHEQRSRRHQMPEAAARKPYFYAKNTLLVKTKAMSKQKNIAF